MIIISNNQKEHSTSLLFVLFFLILKSESYSEKKCNKIGCNQLINFNQSYCENIPILLMKLGIAMRKVGMLGKSLLLPFITAKHGEKSDVQQL